MPYKLPYSIEARMLTSLGKIHNLIGQLQGYKTLTSNLQLRRTNRIKSLRSSLAIEGNTLSEDQIRAIINGKLVMGPRREILEVKNALETYELLDSLQSISEDDLLKAHKTLMKGLIDDAGIYRQGGVGVVDGEKVIHIAPPFKRVPSLMGDLFDYLVAYEEEIVLKSCVFHYEFEFIHPFSDGNGRMGRLWQTLILKEAYPLLEFVPFETIIFRHQQGYYKALADSQSLGSSEPFIYFMLNALETALAETLDSPIPNLKPEERISAFKEFWKEDSFSRKDYQNYHKDISTATASRDLQIATDLNLVLKEGDKRTTRYSFKS